MRRIVAFALITSMFVGTPLFAAGARQVGSSASLAGTVTVDGKPAPNARIQLRDVNSGQLVGTAQTNAAGAFTFSGVAAGTYAVEVLNPAGAIAATSAAVPVAAGAAVAGVTVGATAAAYGAGAAATAAGGAAAATGISTAVIVTTVAVAAGVVGAIVIANSGNSSPSR